MGKKAGYIHRRGHTYTCTRDSHGRFTRFTRFIRPRARHPRATRPRIIAEVPALYGEKHISFYGTAETPEGIYKARVDAHGNGRDLYDLIRTLKDGYVPKRRYRHVHGRVDRIEDSFFEYFTRGEWTDCDVES
jgi:hypothetical protein